jgi:hypothetical protein
MNFRHLSVGGCLVAALVFLPASSMAAIRQSCAPGKPTAASYTWDFKAEASRILESIRLDAAKAHRQAALIKSYDPLSISWQSHAETLTAIKGAVNDMGRKLCRLEQIRRVVAPWQQQAIDRIAPQITLMANSTEDAINFLNANEGNFWEPAYVRYTDNIAQDSGRVSKSVTNFEEYAKARREETNLEKTLGVKAGA